MSRAHAAAALALLLTLAATRAPHAAGSDTAGLLTVDHYVRVVSKVPSIATVRTCGSSTDVICRRWTSLTRPAG